MITYSSEHLKLRISLILSFIVLFSLNINAQIFNQAQKDSLFRESLSRQSISGVSSGLFKSKILALESLDDLVSDAELEAIKLKNDRLLNSIQADIKDREVSSARDSKRQLKNDQRFWKQNLKELDDRIFVLSSLVDDIDRKADILAKEKHKVDIIKEIIEDEGYSLAIKKSINEDYKDNSSFAPHKIWD